LATWLPFFVALGVSSLVAMLLVVTLSWHIKWSADSSVGPQKLHHGQVPRIGGIAIYIGFAVSLLLAKVSGPAGSSIVHPVALLAALLVPFFAGLYEDISKQFGATARLLATFIAAAMAYYLCGAAIVRFDMPLLDAMLAAVPFASLLFTMFCVGGVAHAFNLADGLNGLLGGLTLASCAVLAVSASLLGDQHVVNCALVLAGATCGFLLFNFPKARLFAGDSGAYVVGTAVALLAIMLVARNPSANPWLAFVAVLYPFTDATCAIVRRLVHRKPVMEPDAEHLHTLLAKRISRQSGINRHSLASFLIVLGTAAFQGAALAFYDSPRAAVIASVAFGIVYAFAWRNLSRVAFEETPEDTTTQVSAPH
jgi:UDP-GlcNAc:undecaprenyl-phosphate/decaprenyl-phosphate GlcNAc-1-phosphate transferase